MLDVYTTKILLVKRLPSCNKWFEVPLQVAEKVINLGVDCTSGSETYLRIRYNHNQTEHVLNSRNFLPYHPVIEKQLLNKVNGGGSRPHHHKQLHGYQAWKDEELRAAISSTATWIDDHPGDGDSQIRKRNELDAMYAEMKHRHGEGELLKL
jgi:hypothetical protein